MAKSKETFHQVLAALTVLLNEVCLGMGSGWTAPSLTLLQRSSSPFALTLEECSWIASLEHFSNMFADLLSASLLDVIGRKPILIISAALFFLQWPFLLLNSVYAVYVSRIVYGIAWGLNNGANTGYLGENSSPKMRGIFGSVSLSMYFFGVMIELMIASYFSYRTTAIINMVLTSTPFFTVFWMKESAQFLIMKGKLEQAEKNFTWLKAGSTNALQIKNEFEKIKRNAYNEYSKKSSLKKIFASRANYKSVMIIFVIYTLTASTGYFPIMSYATMFFAKTQVFSSEELTILLGISQFLVATATSFIIDRFNRRSILLICFSIMSLSHASSALLYYIQANVTPIPYFEWMIFATITLFACMHAFMYPVFFLIRSELFPLSIKAFGGCSALIGYAAFNFLTTKLFLWIVTVFGLYMNFGLFFVITIVLIIFIYLALPETRNKTLLEIQEILEKKLITETDSSETC